MTVRSRAGRFAAVTLGASIGLLGLALPAGADTGHDQSTNGTTATATLDSAYDVRGLQVNLTGVKRHEHPTAWLIGLKGPNGEKLQTYCIELETNLDRGQPKMQEVGWDEYPNDSNTFDKNRTHVLWVLQHSYPAMSMPDLRNDKNVDMPSLTKKEAIAATQAAIWHYSDGAGLNKNDATTAKADADERVMKLYEYLTGDKNTGSDNEPAASLRLTPATVSGHAGEVLGPLMLSTSATGAPITLKAQLPNGVTLTDADGNPLDATALKDGTKIYFKVPADADAGDGSVTVSVKTPVKIGRLFIGMHYKTHPTQSLIVASSGPVERTATAKATWTVAPPTTTTTTAPPTTATPTSGAVVPPSPTSAPTTSPAPAVNNTAEKGGLAYTGVAIGVPVGIGVLLLIGGGALLLVQRKRRRA